MCTLPNRLVMALLMGLTLCGRAGEGDGHSLQWSQTDVLPHLRVRPGMSPSREAMWVESFSEQLSEPYYGSPGGGCRHRPGSYDRDR